MTQNVTLGEKLSDDLKEALPVICQASPLIGAMVGGPVGKAFTFVVPFLARAFEAPHGNLKQLAVNILSDQAVESKLQALEEELLAKLKS